MHVRHLALALRTTRCVAPAAAAALAARSVAALALHLNLACLDELAECGMIDGRIGHLSRPRGSEMQHLPAGKGHAQWHRGLVDDGFHTALLAPHSTHATCPVPSLLLR